MIPFIGFSPDLPPETPGIFLDCQNILPGISAFEAARAKNDAGLGALASQAVGFAVCTKSDNSRRTFAGTASALYEAGYSWADVSKSGGYTLGSDDRWRFAQYGNTTLAAARAVTIQSSISGAFADLSATAPKAAIVCVNGNQAFAFNFNGMGLGDVPEGWACSALGDITNWTPSVATQCVAGYLRSSQGPITAGKPLGAMVVAYKKDSMYLGQYVGAPSAWDWQQLPGQIGAPCQEAVVNTGTAHYFIGPDDFYVFDGTRPAPLNSPLRQWFFSTLDAAYAYRICSAYDRQEKRIFWWFPTADSSGVPSKCVVLNVKTNQWGRMDGAIEAAAEFITPGVTFESLGTVYSTYEDLPINISFDSPYWTAGGAVVSAFGTDHKAYTYSGTPISSSITLNHLGDNVTWTTLSRIKPRFILAPTSASLTYAHSNTDATAFSQNITSSLYNNWFDVLWSAQWHKVQIDFTGPVKLSGFDMVLTPDGDR